MDFPKTIFFYLTSLQNVDYNRSAVGKETAGMERIDRLYALLERDDIDEDTKAALLWAIFELEGK